MAGLSSPGIGSGLDINGLITKLMDVEKLPLKKLDTKEANHQAKLTAYGTLKGALSSLQTAVRGLATPTKFNTTKATAADAAVLSATTTSIAKPGSYGVEVTQLAESHKISAPPSAGAGFADPATAIGTGTLTMEFGTYDSGGNTFTLNANKAAKTITIDSTNNSLSGIRDAVNAANAGVAASIINDGSGYRLVLSSTTSGAENSLRITVNEGTGGTNTDTAGLSQLAYNPTAAAGSGKNMEQTVAAKSAILKIDGITITKPTNNIGDAISGLTLNLLKTNAGSPTQLTVARETTGVKTAVEDFVKSYNELAATMKDLGGYNFETQKGGLLLGDTALRSVQAQMRAIVSQQLPYADGGLSSTSDLGISFQKDGTLLLNSSKLDAVLADSTKNVGSLFATLGVTSDSLVSYAGSSASTRAGRYGINLTQAATRGTATGASALGATTVITAGVNDTLTLKLDGTTTTITLTPGSYSTSGLVAELQTRINSDSTYLGQGSKVTVALDGSSRLVLNSSRYGSTSNVEVTGGTATSGLFGASTSSVTGVDVAGEIGGVAASGAGQLLTGSGDASGLQLLIDGSGTGARGTVGFSFGIAYQLDKALDQMLGSTGSIATRTGGIDSSIKDIADQRSTLNLRLESIEKRYRAQFNALDGLIASMQQTSSYLTQQLANLPGTSSSN
ncbi:MAG: flagellar filament capping protein FliD [Sulfurisoma sp.]|nr:flagellar filament capping protein FliD [Sulfurisoma sp.]